MGIPIWHYTTGVDPVPGQEDQFAVYVSDDSYGSGSPPTVASVLRDCVACYSTTSTLSLTLRVLTAVGEVRDWIDLWPDQDGVAFYDTAAVLICAHAVCRASQYLQQPVDNVAHARARALREELLTGICDRQQEEDIRESLTDSMADVGLPGDMGFPGMVQEECVIDLRAHLSDPGRYPLSP